MSRRSPSPSGFSDQPRPPRPPSSRPTLPSWASPSYSRPPLQSTSSFDPVVGTPIGTQPRRTSPLTEYRDLPEVDPRDHQQPRPTVAGEADRWRLINRPGVDRPRPPIRQHSSDMNPLKQAICELAVQRKNQFSPSAHADLIRLLYMSLFGNNVALFLPGPASFTPAQWSKFSLTEAQTGGSSHVDVKGKGREREWSTETVTGASPAAHSTVRGRPTGMPVQPGHKCEKGFDKGEVVYRCKNCSVSEYFALLCTTCFASTDHTGHAVNVKVATGPGEYCSCGDPQVFKNPLFCTSHPTATAPPSPHRTSSEPVPPTSTSFPSSDQPTLTPRSLLSLTNPGSGPVAGYLPADAQEVVRQTITTVLDYILDTLDLSPEETALPKSEEALRMQPTAETSVRQWDPSGTKSSFAVVLWNDEKHTREDVVVQLGDAAGWGDSAGWDCAEKLHTEGRDIIEISDNVPRLLHIAHTLAQIDLGVTLRASHDTFRESVSATMVSFLLDLCTSSVASSPTVLRKLIVEDLLRPRAARADETRLRERAGLVKSYTAVEKEDEGYHARLGEQEWPKDEYYWTGGRHEERTLMDEVDGNKPLTRLDWLLVYHTRWWKKPRAEFQQVFSKLLMVDEGTRLEMSIQFAKVFPRLIDLFLFIDRESEHCTATLASKLFGIPAVASHIVQHQDLLTRYLHVLQSFYTNQFPNKQILVPPPVPLAVNRSALARVDPESEAFKMKKAAPLFSHLKDLLSSEGVQAQIASKPAQIRPLLDLFAVFTCMNSSVRAAFHHVEYESEAWIKAFQVSGELGRVARAWGDAYQQGRLEDLLGAIETTTGRLAQILRFETETLDPVRFTGNRYHSVQFGADGKSYISVHYDVTHQAVSFHNPLHWLLAGMLKQVALLKDVEPSQLLQRLVSAGAAHQPSYPSSESEQDKWMLLLMDYPLRVVVYVAQLRNGLWVRNGQSMRQQHHHYREHTALGVREVAWDNDIFLLQVAFCLLDTNLVLVSLLDRFLLTRWFSGDMDHDNYAHPGAGMVEEFLLLLIVCLSEPCNVAAWSVERFVRREVVHALVLGSSTYSELVKKLPERANDCPLLGSIIDEVATYKAPDTATDFGSYELKDECFAEIDPLFHHYSRNQKQEVDEILEKRYQKQSGGKKDYLHVPKAIEIPAGPYRSLPLAFKSPLLAQIVFFTLHNLLPVHRLANKEGPSDGKTRESQESVLELALHLAMLCLQEQPIAFSTEAWTSTFGTDFTLLDLLEQIESEDLFKNIKQRAVWCLDSIVLHSTGEARHKEEPAPKPTAAATNTPRKLKAAARQAAIMQKFSKDQQAFLDAHGDEDDEMEDEHDDQEIVYGACMVCQEDCTSSVPCGSMALVQPSKLIRHSPMNSLPWLEESIRIPTSLDRPSTSPQPPQTSALPDAFPRNSFKFGLYTSTCGHLMHLNCFESYTKTTENRHHAQAARNHPENVARREFNCPLCKSLGNVLLPMQNPYDRPGKPVKSDELPLRDWLRFINTEALRDVPDTAMMFQHRTETGELPPLFADASPVVNVPAEERDALFEPSRKMLGDLYAVVRPISQQSVHLRGRAPPESLMQERPTQGMYLPDELVAWTIAGLEITQRGQSASSSTNPGSTVADSLNVATTQLLKCLLGSLRLAAFSSLGGTAGLISARYGLFARLLPEWYRDNKISTPVLLRDPLGILVEGAALAFEYLQPILILTYYAEVCRAVIGMLHLVRSFPGRPMSWLRVGSVDASKAREIFGDVRSLIGGMCSHSRILQFEVTEYLLCLPDEILARLLYAYTLPFVRRAAILQRVVKANVPGQSTLVSAMDAKLPEDASEYLRLLTSLNIPLPSVALSPPPQLGLTTPPPTNASITDTVSSYLKQFSAFYGPRSQTSLIRLEYPSIYQLAAMPTSLEEVFERYGRRQCGNCRTVPQGMAVCLFCGEGVCVGVSCCREDVVGGAEGLGECNLHMRKCNAPVGIFLDLRKWQILWLWAGSGSWGPNVYLDIHGELDQSMKRGFFQYLSQPRLDEIRKAWLTHGVPSFVARKMEALLDGGGWGAF